ncbi:MAG TPA: isoprenylcysteine carboxylmethyltransferase family protein [Candidatus Angelobacter sp.]
MPSYSRIATRLRVPLGFLFAAAYFWFAHPDWIAIAVGSGFIVVGLGIRAMASGHIRKNAQLATTGPYAYTRNPLYLGSLMMAAGFIIAARNVWIGLAACALFFAIYLPVIFAEEKYLRSAFPEYEQYAAHVPRLFPRPTSYRTITDGGLPQFSRELYWRHREYNSILGSLFMLSALILKLLLFKR